MGGGEFGVGAGQFTMRSAQATALVESPAAGRPCHEERARHAHDQRVSVDRSADHGHHDRRDHKGCEGGTGSYQTRPEDYAFHALLPDAPDHATGR